MILEAKQISQFGRRAEEPEKDIRFLLGGTDTGHLVVLDFQTVGIIFSVKVCTCDSLCVFASWAVLVNYRDKRTESLRSFVIQRNSW